MKAKKLPSGAYRVRLSVGKDPQTGKYTYKSFTADTPKEAMRLAAEYSVNEKIEKQHAMKLKDAMEQYNKLKESVLSPSTMREYYRYSEKVFKDMWEYDLSSIDTQICQKWINDFSKTLSAKSVRNIYGYLISVLSFFKYGKDIDITLPQKEKVEYHVVTDEELRTLLKATEGTELGIAIALAAFIPARRSEICALTNDDIDRVHNTITINKAKVKDETESFVLKPPKTYGSYRTVELPKAIIDMIPDKPGEIISCSPNGLEDRFVKKLASLNLKFRFHDLRHYGATFLHAQGIPDKYIMQRGGWSSVSTLQNIYTHCLPTETKIASNAVTEKFNSLME